MSAGLGEMRDDGRVLGHGHGHGLGGGEAVVELLLLELLELLLQLVLVDLCTVSIRSLKQARASRRTS